MNLINNYIMFLKNTSYYNANDITKIVEEDNDYIYYHDNLNRRCYIEKGLEGVVFERVDHEL